MAQNFLEKSMFQVGGRLMKKKTVFDKKIFIFYFSQMTLHGFILHLQAFRMHGI